MKSGVELTYPFNGAPPRLSPLVDGQVRTEDAGEIGIATRGSNGARQIQQITVRNVRDELCARRFGEAVHRLEIDVEKPSLHRSLMCTHRRPLVAAKNDRMPTPLG